MTASIPLPDPPSPNGKEVYVPATRAEWRAWLESQPERTEGVWVAFPKKSSPLEGPRYDDLVEESLCFGEELSVASVTSSPRVPIRMGRRRRRCGAPGTGSHPGSRWWGLRRCPAERLA